MRNLILAFVVGLFCLASEAAQITCYSGTELMYAGKGHNLQYNGDYLAFIENKSHRKTYIFGDCVITIKNSHSHK